MVRVLDVEFGKTSKQWLLFPMPSEQVSNFLNSNVFNMHESAKIIFITFGNLIEFKVTHSQYFSDMKITGMYMTLYTVVNILS